MAGKRKLVLFRGDKPLWIIVTVLFLVSLLVVYSATAAMAYREVGGNTSYYLFRQARFILVGFFVIIVVHWIDYRYYARYAKALFQLSVVLVLLTYVIGISLNEASRWIRLPGLGFTFQPSELLKVTLVIVVAQQLGIRQAHIDKIPILPALTPGGWKKNPQRNFNIWYKTTRPLLLPIIVAILIVLPANFSTAAIIWVTCLIMMMVGRVRQKELNRLIALSVLGGLMIILVMKFAGVGRFETWVNRMVQFVKPESEMLAESNQSRQDTYQIEQAEIAIASGGIAGKGPGNSTQRSQLPHAYSDFAYAFIIEEYGLIGGIAIFVLYLWIFYRSGLIVRRCNRPSQGLMVLGLSLIITMQAFINMSVSVGLLPVTGQPLPFISLGGSSVFFTSIAIGMILGVSRESERELAEQEAQEKRLAQGGALPAEDDFTEPPRPEKRRRKAREERRGIAKPQPPIAGRVAARQAAESEMPEEFTVSERPRDAWGDYGRHTKEVVNLMDDEDEQFR